MQIGLAFQAFFAALFNKQAAGAIEKALQDVLLPPADPLPAAPRVEPKPVAAPVRSEALTLLATLQREARFIDIVKEPLGDYTDQQIGAAARDVLRDCGEVIERLFQISEVVDEPEGAEIEAPAGFDAGKYRLIGNVSGQPPFHGQLVHHGWQATRCDLPQWSGTEDASLIVAPVEVEIN